MNGLRAIWTQIWITVVVAVVLLALYTSLGRQLVPLLETWQPETEQWLSQQLGQPVTMEVFRGDWSRLSPVLQISGLSIAGPEGIRIDELQAELDVGATLFYRLPVFSRVDVRGVRSQVQQLGERTWQLAPGWHITLPEAIPAGEAASAALNAERPLWARLLELQQSVLLRDWKFHSENLQGETDDLQINQLHWRSLGHQRELSTDFAWGREQLAHIRLQAYLEGDVWPWHRQNGRIYLEIDEQEWTRWIPDQLPAGLHVHTLRGSARGWLTLRSGDLQALYLEAGLPELRMSTSGEELTLSQGRLQVAGQHSGDDWHLRLSPVFDQPLPFDSLSLSAVMLEQGKGWQLGVPQVDITRLREFLHRHALLPEFIARYIDGTNPHGSATNLRVSLLPGEAGRWQTDIRASLHDIESDAYHGIPALQGVSGELHLQPQAGVFRVQDNHLNLHLADLYPEAWSLLNVRGAFHWAIYPHHYQLWLEDLQASLQPVGLPALPFTAGLQILLPHQSVTEPSLSLLLGLPEAPLAVRQQLIPSLVDPAVRQWLDEALQHGQARQVAFALQTVLSQQHPPYSTTSQLALNFSEAGVQYLPDWPAAAQLSGRLLLDAPALDVWLDRGQTLGGQLEPHSGRIRLRPEQGHSTLELSARLSGDSREGLRYFTETPLRDAVNNAFQQWQASGPLQASVALRMPLGVRDAQPDVHLEADLRDNQLYLGDLQLRFSGLTGLIRYSTQQGVSAEQLDGEVFAGRFRSRVHTVTEGDGPMRIHLRAQGDASWSAFREWQPLFLFDPISGSLAYDADLTVDAEGVRLQLQSDLQGTRVALPYPLGKDSAEKRTLQAWLQVGQPLRIQFDYDRQINADLALGAAGLERGQIVLGGLAAQLPHESGVELTGRLDTSIVAEDWWDTWQHLSGLMAAQESAQRTAGTAASASGSPLQRVNVRFGQVLAWGIPMGNTSIQGAQGQQRWDFHVDSTLMRGLVHLPLGDDAQPIGLELDYLHFPEPEPLPLVASDADDGTVSDAEPDRLADLDPASLPALNMTLAELFVGGRHYGRWQLSSRPQEQGLVVSIADSDVYGLRILGDVQWHYQDGRHQTRLPGLQLSSNNVGQVQRGFRQVPVVQGDRMESTLDLQWQGSPLAFNARTLEGTAALLIRDGLVAAEGTGALKAFGALNFNSMARRLKLDFSDLYQSGVSFDVLRANARFADGVMTLTEPMLVDGPGGKFLTSGSTNLLDHSLDMKLAVTFPVTSTLPMVAVLAGLAPPVAASIYVTEKLIGEELSRFTSASYDVRGTWEEPDMAISKAFDDRVDGRKSRSLKQRILSIFGLGDD